MINIFNLILIMLTLISGISWILNSFLKVFFKNIDKDKYRNRYKYLVLIKYFLGKNEFILLCIITIIRIFIIEPFYIPSKSMMPILLAGDFIVVNKLYYDIKNPFNDKTIIRFKNPQRGDIIVFKHTENDIKYYIVKRIIGIPGDTIYYNYISKELKIFNNKKNIFINYKDYKPSNFYDNYNYLNYKNKINILSNGNFNVNEIFKTRLFQKIETLNNKSYNILILPHTLDEILNYYKQNENINTWIVPKDKYFVMGDNRDVSFDSRYFGFIKKNKVIGKVKFIWMSLELNKNFLHRKLRPNRIGFIE